jgi:Sec-independent protein secretion pathway component TatC
MFVPLIVFYEMGILVAWFFGKKKSQAVDSEELEVRS